MRENGRSVSSLIYRQTGRHSCTIGILCKVNMKAFSSWSIRSLKRSAVESCAYKSSLTLNFFWRRRFTLTTHPHHDGDSFPPPSSHFIVDGNQVKNPPIDVEAEEDWPHTHLALPGMHSCLPPPRSCPPATPFCPHAPTPACLPATGLACLQAPTPCLHCFLPARLPAPHLAWLPACPPTDIPTRMPIHAHSHVCPPAPACNLHGHAPARLFVCLHGRVTIFRIVYLP
ncbi:hypothetical protein BC827DRAFT_899826 [Russula dissimulans]|nr:hypothetical protein BC827DRAFT_899826 [Russula dissimulans]